VRNSSLVKCSCAENITGLKRSTETADVAIEIHRYMVEERSIAAKVDGDDNWSDWKCECWDE
jgi:hypothetical protein